MRYDTLWLNKLNMTNFAANFYDLFVPSCDARDPPFERNEINDHIIISRRKAAEVFGHYFSNMFGVDLKACMNELPKTLSKRKSRGCNSEMLLKWIIEKEDLTVKEVGQGIVPFQRSVNIRKPMGSNRQCYHKYCQSKGDSIEKKGDSIQKCKDIDWKKIFPSKE